MNGFYPTGPAAITSLSKSSPDIRTYTPLFSPPNKFSTEIKISNNNIFSLHDFKI